jgi:hypothetical protein
MYSRDFIVTEHAEMRLQERIGCTRRKILKVVRKAWNSKDPLPVWFDPRIDAIRYRANNPAEYRYFFGCIFIFTLDRLPAKNLVTVLPRKRYWSRVRKIEKNKARS